eukprot:TRINITY_DN3262_c0_g1_i1.p1 TRINITY_DN3262_c0_g1~~TRINITY_DN3262_c0_g1_i1.p1  ORF type:complete len:103 (+),score=9.01 TRINITY_DN3262_c0_g1_i1:237-545(+)
MSGVRGILECPISLLHADDVSKIIGSAGVTIKRICKDSGTRISFRGLVGIISGKKESIEKAIQLIGEELQDNISKTFLQLRYWYQGVRFPKLSTKRCNNQKF